MPPLKRSDRDSYLIDSTTHTFGYDPSKRRGRDSITRKTFIGILGAGALGTAWYLRSRYLGDAEAYDNDGASQALREDNIDRSPEALYLDDLSQSLLQAFTVEHSDGTPLQSEIQQIMQASIPQALAEVRRVIPDPLIAEFGNDDPAERAENAQLALNMAAEEAFFRILIPRLQEKAASFRPIESATTIDDRTPWAQLNREFASLRQEAAEHTGLETKNNKILLPEFLQRMEAESRFSQGEMLTLRVGVLLAKHYLDEVAQVEAKMKVWRENTLPTLSLREIEELLHAPEKTLSRVITQRLLLGERVTQSRVERTRNQLVQTLGRNPIDMG